MDFDLQLILKWEMWQIFVAFSEYLNFKRHECSYLYYDDLVKLKQSTFKKKPICLIHFKNLQTIKVKTVKILGKGVPEKEIIFCLIQSTLKKKPFIYFKFNVHMMMNLVTDNTAP